MAFLYTEDKQAEKEIRETTPSTIITNIIKHLGMTLTKQVKNVYNKNFKSLKKEIEEDLRAPFSATDNRPPSWSEHRCPHSPGGFCLTFRGGHLDSGTPQRAVCRPKQHSFWEKILFWAFIFGQEEVQTPDNCAPPWKRRACLQRLLWPLKLREES